MLIVKGYIFIFCMQDLPDLQRRLYTAITRPSNILYVRTSKTMNYGMDQTAYNQASRQRQTMAQLHYITENFFTTVIQTLRAE